MNEKELPTEKSEERNPLELVLEDFKFHIISSAELLRGEGQNLPENEVKFATEEEQKVDEEASEVFKELAEPKLPVLPAENRARLQMQSPNRIYFYWSLRSNPFQILEKIFGRSGNSYSLVAKLINQTDKTEVLYPVGASGSTWFDVESDSAYRVEVGFFSLKRPFIRLLLSNEVETPRSSPSPYYDITPQFAVTSSEFAEVLDVSGYKQDAFEVALAGDEPQEANAATQETLMQLVGEQNLQAKPDELRYVLFALAAGLSLKDFRGQISPSLYVYLENLMSSNAESLSSEKVFAALQESFDVEYSEETEDESELSFRTFGASLVNFQKIPRRKTKRVPRITPGKFPTRKFAPVSSFR